MIRSPLKMPGRPMVGPARQDMHALQRQDPFGIQHELAGRVDPADQRAVEPEMERIEYPFSVSHWMTPRWAGPRAPRLPKKRGTP